MLLVLSFTFYEAYFKWNLDLAVWLHILGSAGVAISSISLSTFLIHFHHQIRHRLFGPSILLWFALLAVFCAADQISDIYTTWVSSNYLSGIIKVSTTVVSLYAILLVRPTLAEILDLINKRELAAAAQRESDNKFRVAFDYAAIGMALVGLDGRWLRVNRSLCEIVDYSAEELLAKTVQDLTYPEDLEHDLEYAQGILEGKRETYRMEKRFYRKNGKLLWVLLSVSLMRTAEGQALCFIHQVQDITKRKTIEYGMVDLTAQLYSEVNELKSQEISQKIEKILQEAELFEGLTIKMRTSDVY